MKQILLFLGFFIFSMYGFSQTSLSNSIESNSNDKLSLHQANGKSSYMKRKGEKIQTTENGIVIHQQDYKPDYPTPLHEPKIKPSILEND
tara:strand:+ start:973 stop:1242 length:270 start_codon:yes stop_codon:yes gene_type:complete